MEQSTSSTAVAVATPLTTNGFAIAFDITKLLMMLKKMYIKPLRKSEIDWDYAFGFSVHPKSPGQVLVTANGVSKDIKITATISCNTVEYGTFYVNGAELIKLLEKQGAGEITLDADHRIYPKQITIETKGRRYNMPALDLHAEGLDWWKMAVETGDYTKHPVGGFQIPLADFLERSGRVMPSVSTDTLRPAMTGMLVEHIDGISKEDDVLCTYDQVIFTCTDAHVLSIANYNSAGLDPENCWSPWEGGLKPGEFIIPAYVMAQIGQLKQKASEDPITLQFRYNVVARNQATNVSIQVMGSSTDFTIQFKGIDAAYPDYRCVMPKDNPNKLTVVRTELIEALIRTAECANTVSNQVILDLSTEKLTLETTDLDMTKEAREDIKVTYAGEPMRIAFNSKLMIRVLKAMPGHYATILFATPTRGCLFFPGFGTVNCLTEVHLQMPLVVGL